jgi:glycosyltransferase involved in cell wall biosynthesis
MTIEHSPLVSIIIPAFNAEMFIDETIRSVLNQSYANWELIIVNDGSTDKTTEIVNAYICNNIHIIHQTNMGVSYSRNVGLNIAKGDFIVFLDADDILSNNFIEQRLKALLTNKDTHFACGEVWHFIDSINNIITINKGIYNNIAENVLLYLPGVDTVPSNYLFRKELFDKYLIRFDERLSSTADRLFLLEVASIAHGVFVSQSPLYYRVHAKSMSKMFTPKLVKDNELFFKIITEKKLIPKNIKYKTNIIHAYILGTSYLKLKNLKGLKWYFWGLKHYSLKFFKYLLRKKF